MEKKIYLVGGAVRDMLLGEPQSDKDYVAVGYSAEEFAHLRQVGKDFPVFLLQDGSELALARTEKKIGAGYNGFEMHTKNVTLADDLKRRDLTINSIAYDATCQEFIDPFGGAEDLRKKILRHTSEAFVEDPLRVLRIARFRAKYGYEWKIHASTKLLIYSMRNELRSLQKERVYKEIEKVLVLGGTSIFFETLFELGVLDVIFPSLYALTTLKEGSVFHLEASVFEHTMAVLRHLADESPALKLTALYHDIAKPHCYRTYGNGANHEKVELVEPRIEIDMPSKIKKRVLFLIASHIKIAILDEMSANKVASFFESFKKDRTLLVDLLRFYRADNEGRITFEPKESLDEERILRTFEAIASYSPQEWIKTHEKPPSNEAIKQHVHAKNIAFVKELMRS
jgi:tRNA nucleotidyltransferase (CCA-adding enzyme)